MGGSSGGGGSSGAVDYPGYLKAYHQTYLGREVFELGAMAIAATYNNPYVTAQAFNPSTALLAIAQEALWLKQGLFCCGRLLLGFRHAQDVSRRRGIVRQRACAVAAGIKWPTGFRGRTYH